MATNSTTPTSNMDLSVSVHELFHSGTFHFTLHTFETRCVHILIVSFEDVLIQDI